MPIYSQTYRAYDGEPRRHFRWWIMVLQEVRVALKSRWLMILLSLPVIGVFGFYAIVIYFVDIIAQNPDHPWAEAARQLPMEVDGDLMFTVLRLNTPFVFLVMIFVGAGLISNDFRYNLIEVYFSKPLSWIDYVLGKVMTLVVMGLALTALPALLLLLLHAAFSATTGALKDVADLAPRAVAFSLCLTVPMALGILACSALFGSRRFASITVFMVVIVNGVVAGALSEILSRPELRIYAMPTSINRLGEAIFKAPNLFVDAPWTTAAYLVAGVSVAAAAVICRKARRAGAAG